MSEFANTNRALKDLFLPSTVPGPQPSSLSEDVQLVHPIFGGLHTAQDSRVFDINGAAAANSVDSPTVPVNKVWYMIAVDLRHNDTTVDRVLGINIQRGAPAISIRVAETPVDIDVAHILSVQRHFILPPGFFIRGSADTIAATFVLTLRAIFLELTTADVIP